MKKTIVFIGGTSRSGSTYLDLLLSNHEKALSLGEIKSIFFPTRKHHFSVIDNALKDEKWKVIIEGGHKNLYFNLEKSFPEIEVFIDSSKDPFWFEDHRKRLESSFNIRNLLIHKTPEDLLKSFFKRGQFIGGLEYYVKYHKKYLSIVKNFRSVSYSSLVGQKEYFRHINKFIECDLIDENRSYSEEGSTAFFGSNSVYKDENNKSFESTRRVYFNEQSPEQVESSIQSILDKDILVQNISKFLLRKDVGGSEEISVPKEYKLNKLYLTLLKKKRSFQEMYKYFFPETGITYVSKRSISE